MATWFERHWPRAHHADSALLISETEAFLAGGAAHLPLGDAQVPAWVWLNPFAHGDVRCIRRIRYGHKERSSGSAHLGREVLFTSRPSPTLIREPSPEEQRWHDTQRLLASDLLALVEEDSERLSYVQQRVLVPLELRLLSDAGARSWSPPELLGWTREALHNITL